MVFTLGIQFSYLEILVAKSEIEIFFFNVGKLLPLKPQMNVWYFAKLV